MIDVRKKVGLVFQCTWNISCLKKLSKDIAFRTENLGLDESEIQRRAEESMELVGLNYVNFQEKPFDLSGGQKRRLLYCRCYRQKPKVLILMNRRRD